MRTHHRTQCGRISKRNARRMLFRVRVPNKDSTPHPPTGSGGPAPLKACAEPDKSDSTPVVMELPCAGSDGKSWPVTEGMLRQWADTYPGVDPTIEARKMLMWLQDPANAKRRKTMRGMGRFAMGWLERAQNSHGGNRASPPRVMPLRPGAASSAPSPFPKLLRTGDPS